MSFENDEFEGRYPVAGPSGAAYFVLSEDEVSYYNDITQRYLSDNHFDNISDLQEIDRILMMELMVWRWANWLSTDSDYDGGIVDPEELRKSIKEFSTELRLVKKQLGIDKATREKDKGSSVPEYIENLMRRAKEFGYHREEQVKKILILFNELSALMTLNSNCDEIEQREMHCTNDDVFKWIRETAIPEYEELDNEFRRGSQRYWVKEL